MRPVAKSLMAGAATIAVYLVVVVATTPALPAASAVTAAFELNTVVILGMGVGVGLQVLISESGKKIGLPDWQKEENRRELRQHRCDVILLVLFTGSLGCCGWWLYILSLLPSVLGSGVSAVLIEHSQSLAYVGLVVIFSFNGLSRTGF